MVVPLAFILYAYSDENHGIGDSPHTISRHMPHLRHVAFPPLHSTVLAPLLHSCIAVHEELEPGSWHSPRPLELLTLFVTDAGKAYTGCQTGRIEQLPGRLVIVAQGTNLSQQVPQLPWRSHYLMLGGALTQELNESVASLPLGAYLAPRHGYRNHAVIQTVETILTRAPGWEWRVLHHLADIIGGLLPGLSGSAQHLDHRIAQIIDASPEQSWSIGDVAQAVDLTPRTLQRYWRQTHGTPLARFILSRRMMHARFLLHAGHSLGGIARHLNFSSSFHLSRVFKRIYGMSPSQIILETSQVPSNS